MSILRRSTAILTFAILDASGAFPQPSSPSKTFEVVSIKRAAHPELGFQSRTNPGQIDFRYVNVYFLLTFAYRVPSDH